MASCHPHSANGMYSLTTLMLPVFSSNLFLFFSATAQAAKNDASPCASDPTPPPRRHRDPPRHTSGGKISVKQKMILLKSIH